MCDRVVAAAKVVAAQVKPRKFTSAVHDTQSQGYDACEHQLRLKRVESTRDVKPANPPLCLFKLCVRHQQVPRFLLKTAMLSLKKAHTKW